MYAQHKLMRLISLWVLVIAVSLGAVSALAAASKKKSLAGKPPVRIHYSGNLEGELEPCG